MKQPVIEIVAGFVLVNLGLFFINHNLCYIWSGLCLIILAVLHIANACMESEIERLKAGRKEE